MLSWRRLCTQGRLARGGCVSGHVAPLVKRLRHRRGRCVVRGGRSGSCRGVQSACGARRRGGVYCVVYCIVMYCCIGVLAVLRCIAALQYSGRGTMRWRCIAQYSRICAVFCCIAMQPALQQSARGRTGTAHGGDGDHGHMGAWVGQSDFPHLGCSQGHSG